MNCWTGTGKIVFVPKITYTQKNVCRAAFLLSVPRARGPCADNIGVIAWGLIAEKVRDMGEGDQIEVRGELQTRTIERPGGKEYRNEIIADQIIFPAAAAAEKVN